MLKHIINKIKKKGEKKMKKLKMVSVLTAVFMLLLAMSFSVMADGDSQNSGQLIKQWSFESNSEGWQIGKSNEIDTMKKFKAIDGTIRAEAIIGQSDPQFVSPDLTSENIVLGNGTNQAPNYIKIRMKNHSSIADEGKVFFMTDGDANYTGDKSKSFPINMNRSNFADIYLKMSDVSGWTGVLKSLRIDPVDKYGMDSSKGGTFIIDEISLYAIPEPEKKTIISQDFDTTYSAESTGHSWWASYLKDSNGSIMARAAETTTEIRQVNNALNIKFTAANQRVDILGFAGDKDTTGTHKASLKIKNNGSSDARMHLKIVGAVDASGQEYTHLMNQSVAPGAEKTITFERDFYQPTAENNAILIQSANACDITVDDVTLTKEDKIALSPLSQIHEGTTNVDVSGAYGLLFNYAVKGGHSQYTHLGLNESGQANIKIYEKDQSTAAVVVSYVVGSGSYAQFCIKPENSLKYNTEYTLKIEVVNTSDYSKTLRNLEVNFKTKPQPEMMGVDADGKETTVLSNTAKIKYTLGTDIRGGFIAAYKDGEMTDVKYIAPLSDENNTIALSELSAISDADTVKAFLWDVKLTPVTNILVLK